MTIFRTLIIVLLIAFSSKASAEWTQINGRSLPRIMGLTVHGGYLFAGAGGLSSTPDSLGVYRSSDNGVTWTHLVNGLTKANVLALASVGHNIFAATLGGGIFRSSDEGDQWVAVNTGLKDLSVYSLAVSDTIIYAGTADGSVYRSIDQGATWSGIAYMLYGPISALCASGNDVYAGGQSGRMIHCASDGTSLREISIVTGKYPVAGLRKIGANLYCSLSNVNFGQGVFLSKNDGVNWTNWNAGLPNTTICSLHSSGSTLIAGSASLAGVYYSINGGPWVDIHTGLPGNGKNGYPYYAMETFAITPEYLFSAGMSGQFSGTGVVWRMPLSGTSITAVDNAAMPVPERFELHQNYPNPFNPSTTISFALPERAHVVLKVYDALGREVAMLASEDLPSGTYERAWNAAGVPSGVYFYRLQAGAFTETKRLVVTK